ncbi:MAG TPA: hypothetical protein VG710_01590, partial [Opitutus sp.]|nr:hypothetical protein [Opitutus sp.]
MRIRISVVVALAGLVAREARAQPAALNPPAPLVANVRGPSPGESARSLQAAERAQEMGLPSAAAAIFQRLIETPGADRQAATLGLATALLDEGKALEAEKVLTAWTGERGAAWHLRKGLAAAAQGETTTAKNERDASHINELPPADRGWHLYLQGTIATMENEPDKAKVLFGQAVDAAGSSLARARFLLKQDEARLRGGGAVSEVALETTRKNLATYQGRKVGYDIARTYAVMLDASGKKGEAAEVLQRQVVSLPPEEHEELDEMRLL